MSSPIDSGALSDSDYAYNGKPIKKKDKKKKQQNRKAATATAASVSASVPTTASNSGDGSQPVGRRGMSLRPDTKRNRPGRYCEPDEIPDTKPAWVHPPVPFNPDLARFVPAYSRPIDSPEAETPSRTRYNAWVKSQQAEEKRRQEAEGEGVAYVSVNVRAEVRDGTSNGPHVVHLPPRAESRRSGEIKGEGGVNKEKERPIEWHDLSKSAQWVLIDYKNNDTQPREDGRRLGLSDAFKSLDLRLSEIIEFVDLYNRELTLYEAWIERIRTTEPANNDLDFYTDVWTNLDLVAYYVSAEDIKKGQQYLRQLGWTDCHDLGDWTGRRSQFFHIADMQDLDMNYLKHLQARGCDRWYGDLCKESTEWVVNGIVQEITDEVALQVLLVDDVEPHTPKSLDEKADPMDLDGAASENGLASPEVPPGFESRPQSSLRPEHPQAARQELPINIAWDHSSTASTHDDRTQHDEKESPLHIAFSMPLVEATPEPREADDELYQVALQPFGLIPESQIQPVHQTVAENAPVGYADGVDYQLGLAIMETKFEDQEPPAQQEIVLNPHLGHVNDDVYQQGLALLGYSDNKEIRPSQQSFAANPLLDGAFGSNDELFSGNSGFDPHQDPMAPLKGFANPVEAAQCRAHGHAVESMQALANAVLVPDEATEVDEMEESPLQSLADELLIPDLAVGFDENLRMAEYQHRGGTGSQHACPLPIRTDWARSHSICRDSSAVMRSPPPRHPLQPGQVILSSGDIVWATSDEPFVPFVPRNANTSSSRPSSADAQLAFLIPGNVNANSSPVRDSSYHRRVGELEGEVRDNMEGNDVAIYRGSNGLGPIESSANDDLAWVPEWYEKLQPLCHYHPEDPAPGWDEEPKLDCAPAQNAQASHSNHGVLQPYQPEHSIAGTLVDPKLRDPNNRQHTILGQPHIQAAQISISNTRAAPVTTPTSSNDVAPLAYMGEELANSSKGHQVTLTNTAAAHTGSASNRSVRLSIMETPNGKAVLQQQPMIESNTLAKPHRLPTAKRTYHDYIHGSTTESVVAGPSRPRARSHHKETAALDSDDDFKGIDVPVCEPDDEDFDPKNPNCKNARKGKAVAKGKKTSATPRKKTKTTNETPQWSDELAPPKPKRKYVRKTKVDTNNNEMPASTSPGFAADIAAPAMASPSYAVHPLKWPKIHAASFEQVYGVGTSTVQSIGDASATSEPPTPDCPQPVIQVGFTASQNSSWGDDSHPNLAAAGPSNASVLELKPEKPKLARPPKEDDNEQSPDKLMPKPETQKTKEGKAIVFPPNYKETPIPLPPRVPFQNTGQRDRDLETNSSAQPDPSASKVGAIGTTSGHQAVDPALHKSEQAPAHFSGRNPFSAPPALGGKPIVPQLRYPRPETCSLVDAFTGAYAPTKAMSLPTPAVQSPQKTEQMLLPALPVTQGSATASGASTNMNIVGNILQSQQMINARVNNDETVPHAVQLMASENEIESSVAQAQSASGPMIGQVGQPSPQQPETKAQKPKAGRKNPIDPNTGRLRMGRPRTIMPKQPAPPQP